MTTPRARPPGLAGPTRFAALSRGQARAASALVALWLLAALTALAVADQPPRALLSGGGGSADEIAMGDGVIENVRHGAGYYPATAEALRQGNHPLRPFTTFRLPTLAVALAMLPARLRALPLYLLTLLTAVAWAARLRPAFTRTGPVVVALASLIAGASAGLQPTLVSSPDIWAGAFIALSLGLRHRGRWLEAAAAAWCAMLVRDVAAAYVITMAVMAWRDGERREAAGWLAALGLFAAVLATHAHAVAAVLHPGDPAAPAWAGMVGLGSVIRAVVLSTGLRAIPLGIAALLFGLSVVGWTAWRDPTGERVVATLTVYGLMIAAGAWGDGSAAALIAPLSLAGLAFVPDAARDLVRAGFGRRITVTRLAR